MTLNFSSAVKAYSGMIDNFAKTISKTPITKTENPLSGEEDFTEGTPINIIGALFTKFDSYVQDKPGLIQNADAVLMIKPGVTLNKNDKLTYDGIDYRVDEVHKRRYNNTVIYQAVQCFKID